MKEAYFYHSSRRYRRRISRAYRHAIYQSWCEKLADLGALMITVPWRRRQTLLETGRTDYQPDGLQSTRARTSYAYVDAGNPIHFQFATENGRE